MRAKGVRILSACAPPSAHSGNHYAYPDEIIYGEKVEQYLAAPHKDVSSRVSTFRIYSQTDGKGAEHFRDGAVLVDRSNKGWRIAGVIDHIEPQGVVGDERRIEFRGTTRPLALRPFDQADAILKEMHEIHAAHPTEKRFIGTTKLLVLLFGVDVETFLSKKGVGTTMSGVRCFQKEIRHFPFIPDVMGRSRFDDRDVVDFMYTE